MSENFDIKCFEIIPILDDDIKINDKISVQITCLEVYNHDVYLGTIDSFVLCYPNLLQSSTSKTSLENRIVKYLGLKKPVNKLKILPILNRLICHCDNQLLMMNSSTTTNFELISTFRLRNIFAFTLNESPVTMDPFQLEICLAKRKLIQIGLINGDKLTLLKEINLTEQPLIMSMDGYFICMASISNYFIINWMDGSQQQLCVNPYEPSSSQYQLPICKYISRNEFLINGPSNLGVFIKTSGISERPPINWGPEVLQIAYSYPYILCLKSGKISIINIIDQKIKEEFLLENGLDMDNFDGQIIVVTKQSRIYQMKRCSWQKQFNELLSREKTQEAIDLYENLYQSGMMTIEEYQRLELIKLHAGFIELKNGNFQQARRFLFDGHCDIDLLLSLNENLEKRLKITATTAMNDENIQTLLDKIRKELDKTQINQFLIDYIDLIQSNDLDQTDFKRIRTAKLLLLLENLSCDSSNSELIRKFFRENSSDNYYCELIERYLIENNLHYHRALYYKSRNQLEKSVEIFRKLEKSEIDDKYYPGIEELIQLLIKCSNVQLIMNHVEFIMEKNQLEGSRILIANTRFENDKFTILNPEFVIRNLYRYRMALIKYLEYLINEMQLTNENIHTTLIRIYIEILSIQYENEEENSSFYKEIKEKLQQILLESDYYDQKIIEKYLSNVNLDYEMAILMGKMGKHREAFEIYLNDQHLDYHQALRHCIEYGRRQTNQKDDDNHHKIYQTLLKIYLDLYRKNGPEVMKPLLNFVNHPECHFDMIETLKILPDEWPLKLIYLNLFNNLNRFYNQKFQSSFGCLLAKSMAEQLKQQQKLRKTENKSIRIDRNSECFLCHTKLIDSKFVWLPSTNGSKNGLIVHDFCYYNRILQNNNNNDNGVGGGGGGGGGDVLID
uniref:Transforming growth factor-beta receptor-associated protein 1-like n=1 Tax=Dermatophagoides pteronyssinus TaxID=6956 RepID=A0A6P6XRQ9_DERPT|nr:transforming growth factor-beta receptor-associated protein 1-like [Dermatophagoides pteronyssinus]